MKTFSIPKPCHEDWNKMTPDAKGAFCGSCQKSVHDFTKKTDEEIAAVFEEKGKEEVCGRFAHSQLSQPVISFGEVDSTSRLAKFLYSLLLVFGSTLFVGNGALGQNVKVMGKMSARPISYESELQELQGDTTVTKVKRNTPITCGLVNVPNAEITSLGQAVYIPKEEIKITGDTVIVKDAIIEDEQLYIKGGARAIRETIKEDVLQIDITESEAIDTIPYLIPVIDTVEFVELVEPPIMMGSVAYVTNPVLEIIPVEEIIPFVEEDIIPSDTTAEERNSIIPEIFIPASALELSVSPNPSKGEIVLSYILKNDMPVRIDLFDSNGKFIRTLMNQAKQYAGKYNVSYNLSELQNGIYNAVLITAAGKVSSKVIIAK